MLDGVEVRDDDIIGSLDEVGMFPNILVGKTLEVVKEELQKDITLWGRMDWKPEDISKLLEISVETYFKTLDGQIYFQRDGLPIGKSISKPTAGIYIHWFEKSYVFNEDSQFKNNIVFWKRQMDDVFFFGGGKKMIWSCLSGFLNGIENKVQFTLEIEKEIFCLSWMLA